jgi:glycosyltransferase involved in cell wall biosynthesis
MKILHLISDGYEGGGAETLLVKLIQEQKKNSNEVKVFSSDIEPEKHHFSDFEFRHIDGGLLKKFLLFLFNPYSYFKLKQILHDFNPNIVHLHTMLRFSPSVLFLLKKYPTVLTVHGPEEFLKSLIIWTLPPNRFKNGDYKTLSLLGTIHYLFISYIQRMVYKVGLKNIDLFIAPSNFMKHQISMEYKNTYLLHNGITLKRALKPIHGKKLIFVGGLKKGKGVNYLIKAMPHIIDKIPDASLDIVGDGGERDEFTKLVNDLKLQNKIKFLGWVNNENIRNIYKNADIVVIPSIWPENLPMVCIEAMSVGRPLVGTNIGGIPELIENGKTGFLVDHGNSKQIAERVIELFSNRELMEEMGKNARIKAEQFSIEKHVLEMEKVYTKVIEKYKIQAKN